MILVIAVRVGLKPSIQYLVHENEVNRVLTIKELEKLASSTKIDLAIIETKKVIDVESLKDKVGKVVVVTREPIEGMSECIVVGDRETLDVNEFIGNDVQENGETIVENENAVIDKEVAVKEVIKEIVDDTKVKELTYQVDELKRENKLRTQKESELLEEIEKLKAQMSVGNEDTQQLEKLNKQYELVTEEKKKLEVEVKETAEKLQEVLIELNTMKNRNLADISEEDLKILKDNLTWVNKEKDALEVKFEKYREESEKEIYELRDDKEQLEKYISSSEKDNSNRADEFKLKMYESNKVYNCLMEILDRASSELYRTNHDLSFKVDQVEKLEVQLSDSNKEIQQLREEVDNLKSSNEELDKLASSVETKIAIARDEEAQKVIEISNELKLVKIDKDKLETDNERLRKELLSTNTTLTNLTDSIKQVELIRNKANNLEETNDALNKEIENLIEQKKELVAELGKKDEKISDLNIELGHLSEDLDAMRLSGGAVSVSKIRSLNAKYHGRAKIIAVFGNGSYGVTTTVQTLYELLPGKKLVMDLDIINPSIDARLQKNPSLKCLGIEELDKATAFGSAIDRGSTFTAVKMKDAIINVNNKLDYFGGVYHEFNRSKLLGLSFTDIFDAIPDVYDYIIIDLGKIKLCTESDCLIRTITDIAYKNVLVTKNDRFYVRNTFLYLSKAGIKMDNLVWVLNMSINNSIDARISQWVKCNKLLVPVDREIAGRPVSFAMATLLKAKVKELIDLVK